MIHACPKPSPPPSPAKKTAATAKTAVVLSPTTKAPTPKAPLPAMPALPPPEASPPPSPEASPPPSPKPAKIMALAAAAAKAPTPAPAPPSPSQGSKIQALGSGLITPQSANFLPLIDAAPGSNGSGLVAVTFQNGGVVANPVIWIGVAIPSDVLASSNSPSVGASLPNPFNGDQLVNVQGLGNSSISYELWVAALASGGANPGVVSSGQSWSQPANDTCTSCAITSPGAPTVNNITAGPLDINVALGPGTNSNPYYTVVAVNTASPTAKPIVYVSTVANMTIPASVGTYRVWAYASVTNGSCTNTTSCTSDAVLVRGHRRGWQVGQACDCAGSLCRQAKQCWRNSLHRRPAVSQSHSSPRCHWLPTLAEAWSPSLSPLASPCLPAQYTRLPRPFPTWP